MGLGPETDSPLLQSIYYIFLSHMIRYFPRNFYISRNKRDRLKTKNRTRRDRNENKRKKEKENENIGRTKKKKDCRKRR